jgi:aerobic carbon-monoxide dehydrogenase medium subunit
MALRKLDYIAARSVEEACAALTAEPDGAKLIAGGQSVLRMMKYRVIEPTCLVDIKAIRGLDYVRRDDSGLRIGALATHTQVLESQVVQNHFPVLAEAEREVSAVAVRNWGTLVGNLCVGHAASDPAPALLALDAQLSVAGIGDGRLVPLAQFFKGHLWTDLQPGEVVSEIQVPNPPPGCGMAYLAHTGRAAMETPLVSAAVVLKLERGRCVHARIALAGSAETPIRAHGAEQALLGTTLDEATILAAASAAQQDASPDSDVFGSAEYRTRLVAVYVRDAIRLAARRAAA